MNDSKRIIRGDIAVKFPRSDWIFLISLILFLCAEPLQKSLSALGLTGTPLLIITLAIVYSPLLFGIVVRGSLRVGFFLLVMIISLVFGGTLLLYPEYKEVLLGSNYYYSFISQVVSPFGSVFGFLFIEYVDDFKKIKKSFVVASVVLFIYYSMQAVQSGGIWVATNTGKVSYYSMSFSYGILFPVLVFLTHGFETKKLIPIILACLGVVEIIIYGARGSLVVLMLFLMLYIGWMWRPKRRYTKYLLFSIAGILLVFLCLSTTLLSDILNALLSKLTSMGYNSRSLSVLLNRSILSEDRITTLWPATLNTIGNSVLIGNGLYSNHYWNGGYPHNILLELLVDFGVLGGGLLIYLLGKTLFYIFKKSNSEETCFVFIVLISYCFGMLMLSSSFWYEKFFWIYLAMYFKFRSNEFARRTLVLRK